MSKSQAGVSSAGVVITILVVMVLVLGSALAYKFHEDRSLSSTPANTTATNTTSNSGTNTPASADNTQTSKVSAHTLAEGNTFVEDTYQQYIQTQNNSHVGAKQGLELIKAKLTPNLYNSISAKYSTEGADAVVCGQSIPSTFGVDSSVQASGSASYTVNEMFGSTTVPVKVTVDLNQLLISGITCPN